MYNGIGLQTARGSGTNGYVQRNMSFVPKSKEKVNYRTEEELRKLDSIANKKPNEGILAHERKRVIELKCLEMQELMENEGFAEEEINSKVSMLRKALLEKDDVLSHEVPKDDFGRPLVKESHQMAEANQEKNMKMREALGISQYFVEGSSLDPERKAREAAAAAAAAEAQKKYSLVPVSSSSSPERESEKDKAKKKKMSVSKRSDESVPHKKKKTSRKHRRERSESFEVKKKRKAKKSRDKGRHKREKYKHRAESSSSQGSGDSDNSDLESKSSCESSVSRSVSVVHYSSSNEDRSPSISKGRKRKDSTKHTKSHKGKKLHKTHSSEDSLGHSKSRKSRRDKYEAAKKKKTQISKGTCKARSVTTSSSSDAESCAEQYYRLEPVFVKSKSKHKKDVQLIEVQSKKRGSHTRHDKHLEKRKKRPHHSSSSSSSAVSSENTASRSNKKRRKHSTSPALIVKCSHERARNLSKKHHKKHRSSSSDDHTDDRSNSSSKSLSYSPIPNSRSTGQNTSKKLSSVHHGHSSYKDIILSGNNIGSLHKEKELSKLVKINVHRSKEKHSKDSMSDSDNSSHYHKARANSDHMTHTSGKHNGYQKVRNQHSVTASSPKLTKRNNSSLSESDDHNPRKGKGLSKSNLHSKKHSLASPAHYANKTMMAKTSSPSFTHKVKNKKHQSSSSESSCDSLVKIAYRRKTDKKKEVGRRRHHSSSSSQQGQASNSRSRSRSNSSRLAKQKTYKKHKKILHSEKRTKRTSSQSQSRSHSRTSDSHIQSASSNHIKSHHCNFMSKNGKQSGYSPPNLMSKTDDKNHSTCHSDIKSPTQAQLSNRHRSKSPSLSNKKEVQNLIETCKDSRQSPCHRKIRSENLFDEKQTSAQNYHCRNSLIKSPLKVEKQSRSLSHRISSRSRSRSTELPHKNHMPKNKCSSKSPHSSPNCRVSQEKNVSSSVSPLRKQCLKERHDKSMSPVESRNSKEKHVENLTPVRHESPTLQSENPQVQRKSPPKSPDEVTENKVDKGSKNIYNLSCEKLNDIHRSCRKHSRSISESPHSRRSRSRSITQSPYNERSVLTVRNTSDKSRESSHSSAHEKSKSRSKSASESKSRSRSHSCSRSGTRSRSYSPSQSRSRSRSKSSHSRSRSRSYTSRSKSRSAARSPSIPRRKGSPSFLDKRRITRARSVSGHRRCDSRSYSRSPTYSYYDHSSSSSNFSRVYRR